MGNGSQDAGAAVLDSESVRPSPQTQKFGSSGVPGGCSRRFLRALHDVGRTLHAVTGSGRLFSKILTRSAGENELKVEGFSRRIRRMVRDRLLVGSAAGFRNAGSKA